MLLLVVVIAAIEWIIRRGWYQIRSLVLLLLAVFIARSTKFFGGLQQAIVKCPERTLIDLL
jgi:hypothetical protein